MRKKYIYQAPQAVWSELDSDALICDSYDSGIDDFDYEYVDWNA